MGRGKVIAGRVLFAGALVIGAGVGTVATALPASAAPTTIKLVDQNKPRDVVFVDTGTPGFSVGDQIIFHSNLLCTDNCGVPGTKVGTVDVTCTIMLHNRQDCEGTAQLFGRGKINFGGVVPSNHSSFVFGINGGTGEFVGAAGTIFVNTTNATDAGNGEKITITLV
jgi:hypothetical protein